MSPKIHTQLIYGAISAIPYLTETNSKSKFRKSALKLLLDLSSRGYYISNPEILLTFNKHNILELSTIIEDCISATTKEAFYLRESFGVSYELEEFTPEDILAVLAK